MSLGISNFQFNLGTQYLFRRQWSVALGPPGSAAVAEYQLLRTRFDIDKQALGVSNKSKIEIFGLSPESRQKILKGWNVRLKAGYSGLVESLFLGAVLPNGVHVTREGADIILSLECGDGEAAITFATIDKPYQGPVSLKDIISDLASISSLVTGVIDGIPTVVYNNGFTAHGQVRDILTQLCKSNGLEWHVQNGALNVFPLRTYNGQSVIDVNLRTGMIGMPSSDGGFMQFTSLLNPKLTPGSAVKLTSVENTALNGYYKIKRSHFEGDSHDTKWQVTCECILLQRLLGPSAGPAAQSG